MLLFSLYWTVFGLKEYSKVRFSDVRLFSSLLLVIMLYLPQCLISACHPLCYLCFQSPQVSRFASSNFLFLVSCLYYFIPSFPNLGFGLVFTIPHVCNFVQPSIKARLLLLSSFGSICLHLGPLLTLPFYVLARFFFKNFF